MLVKQQRDEILVLLQIEHCLQILINHAVEKPYNNKIKQLQYMLNCWSEITYGTEFWWYIWFCTWKIVIGECNWPMVLDSRSHTFSVASSDCRALQHCKKLSCSTLQVKNWLFLSNDMHFVVMLMLSQLFGILYLKTSKFLTLSGFRKF